MYVTQHTLQPHPGSDVRGVGHEPFLVLGLDHQRQFEDMSSYPDWVTSFDPQADIHLGILEDLPVRHLDKCMNHLSALLVPRSAWNIQSKINI